MSPERRFQVSILQARRTAGDEVDLIEVPLPLPVTQKKIDFMLRSGRAIRKHLVDVVGRLK